MQHSPSNAAASTCVARILLPRMQQASTPVSCIHLHRRHPLSACTHTAVGRPSSPAGGGGVRYSPLVTAHAKKGSIDGPSKHLPRLTPGSRRWPGKKMKMGLLESARRGGPETPSFAMYLVGEEKDYFAQTNLQCQGTRGHNNLDGAETHRAPDRAHRARQTL